MKKKIWAVAGTGLVAVALGAYLFAGGAERQESNEMDTQSIKRMVQDISARNIEAQSASITSRELIVADEDNVSTTYALPQKEFFLSIAPYVENTHPCATHSLTGCQGELADKEFSVAVEDLEGNTVLDKSIMKSHPNGFIDLWLPRDNTYRITVEHEGKTAESEISTFESDDTCITTMQIG